MYRRQIVTASAASLIGFGLGFVTGRLFTAPSTSSAELVTTVTTISHLQKVTFAYTGSKRFNHYHLEVARRYFNKKGYDMELLFVEAARGREMFATRKSHISNVSPVGVLALAESGEKVMFGPVLHLLNTVIVSNKNLDEVLSAARVRAGISVLGSPDQYAASQFLKKHGVKRPQWVEIGLSRNRLAAVENGSIEVASVTYQEVATAINQGLRIKIVSEPYNYWLVASFYNDWVDSNQKTLKDFISSLIFAKLYCAADRNRLIRESIRYGEIEETPQNIEIVRNTYELFDKENFWTTVTPPDDFYRNFYQWAVEEKILNGTVDITSLTDPIKQYINETFEA